MHNDAIPENTYWIVIFMNSIKSAIIELVHAANKYSHEFIWKGGFIYKRIYSLIKFNLWIQQIPVMVSFRVLNRSHLEPFEEINSAVDRYFNSIKESNKNWLMCLLVLFSLSIQ